MYDTLIALTHLCVEGGLVDYLKRVMSALEESDSVVAIEAIGAAGVYDAMHEADMTDMEPELLAERLERMAGLV